MYNESIKERFICEKVVSDTRKVLAKTVFNALEKYEIELGKDVCEMSDDELSYASSKVSGMRYNTWKTRAFIIIGYINWCRENGVENARKDVVSIEDPGIVNVKNMTVANPSHFQKELDAVFEKEYDDGVENIFRCYMWLSYMGLLEDEIMSLTVEDVDIESMSVICNNVEYPIYREALKPIKNCSTLSYFRVQHPNYTKDLLQSRVEGRLLLRSVKGQPDKTRMRSDLSRRVNSAIESGKTSFKMSFNRAWISGTFYRAYEKEQFGVAVDFKETAYRLIDGKGYKFDTCRWTIDTKARVVASDLMSDYIRWKKIYVNR